MGMCAAPPADQGHGRWPHRPPLQNTIWKDGTFASRQTGPASPPSQRTRAGTGCLRAEGGEPRSVSVLLLWDWTECLPTKLPEEER